MDSEGLREESKIFILRPLSLSFARSNPNSQKNIVTPADLRVAWHYLPMAFGPQLTSYDVRKAAYECFLPDLRQEMYRLHECQLRANNYQELPTLLDCQWAEATHESLKARRTIVSLETTPTTTPLVALVSNTSEK